MIANRKLKAVLVGGVLTVGLWGAQAAETQPSEIDVKALLKRIEELEQKVKLLESRPATNQNEEIEQKIKVLERKNELAEEAAGEKAKATPLVVIGANGLQATSADSNFVFQLRGVLQVDSRTFFNDGGVQGNDSFLLRRARPIFQGTIFRDFDFLFVPDFGASAAQQAANPTPVIQDANLNYRNAPWLQLRAGKFKSPVGLEQLQSDPVTLFNERALPSSLTPNRDIGFQVWGDLAGGIASYAAGVFNGVGDGRNIGTADFEDNREFAGRLFFHPFKKSNTASLQGLGVGVGGSWGDVSGLNGLPATTGGVLPGYATDGQQQFFAYNPTTGVVLADGDHWRLSPQAYYFNGPFGLLGEYVISNQRVSNAAALAADELQHTSWQVSASWVLTGEDATYAGVTPRKPLDLRNGTWGAFQVVGRYAELDIDDDTFPLFSNPATSASQAQAWSVGLNWYLNKNVRLNANYSHTTFSGGGGAGGAAPAVVTREDEEVFFTRIQLAF